MNECLNGSTELLAGLNQRDITYDSLSCRVAVNFSNFNVPLMQLKALGGGGAQFVLFLSLFHA